MVKEIQRELPIDKDQRGFNFAKIRLALGGVGGNGTNVCNIVAFS
jgi:hypothetical protein